MSSSINIKFIQDLEGGIVTNGYIPKDASGNIIGHSVNIKFIQDLEGGFVTKGYVPKDASGNVLGQSGVTIGAGIDLGGKTEQHFKNIGISNEHKLKLKLKPYLGKQKNEADMYLQKYPLVLSQVEASTLSDAEIKYHVEGVKSKYDKAIKGSNKKGFDDLTVNQRTVICSVLFQYGRPERVPKFWTYVTEQEWNKVENELRNFNDKYPTRRGKEADLLMKN